jgi:Uma2 family endonuclease
MNTVVKLGPADHGRPLTLDEFFCGDYQEGSHYELIDGRLYVSPVPNLPEADLEDWLCTKLRNFAEARPDVLDKILARARVFIPGRPKATCPEPDASAYHGYPHHLPRRERRWRDISPLLVGEVLSADDPDKDLVRNVELYRQVPTIREYWIVDPREDPDLPRLLAASAGSG